MCVNLVLLAKGTAFDVSADEGGESGPPELSGNQLMCFQETGVSSQCVIMAVCKDGAAKGVICGNVDMSFVSEDTCFDLPICKSGPEGERDVFVHGLESLEDEGVTHRCRLNAVGEGGVNQVNKEGRREEGDVSVVGVVRGEEVGSAREGIGTSKKFTGNMDHFQVEVSKVNEPTRLAAVERLGLAEIGKVLVVSEDLHQKGRAMKIVVPGFQGADNGKEFTVIDVIVPLGGGEGLREVGAWMPIAIGVGLEEDGARRVFRGVRGDREGGREVGEVEDGFGEEEMFEGVEGGLASRGPVPREVLFGEV